MMEYLLKQSLISVAHQCLRLFLSSKAAEFVDIEIERVSEYGSEDRLSSALTERQREILKVAVEQGYYEVPRQATIRDIADAMELSQATVGEYLQKIEARVLSASVH
ncbi:helix-turn-helix domain-containing protein [Haladaptatus halobius]|uniref:helix-turn-helix domain-containing protein n=1 Tax=Haladaptatus halobius TaxID=2884875 RepID=UPI0034A12FE1